MAPPRTAILCSLVLRPPQERNTAELTLVAGVAAAETVERATGRPAKIKWPNDVVLAGRKVAGVLAEARDGAVVLGVGLNVNQGEDELPAGGGLPAGSLATAGGGRRDRAPLFADLLRALEADYDRWRAGGLAALHDRLARRDFLRGREVIVGGERALALGIDIDGRLEVESRGRRRLLVSGEVVLAP